MKTIQERLKSKGITPTSRHHNYDYLYKSVVEIMQEYENEMDAEFAKKFTEETTVKIVTNLVV